MIEYVRTEYLKEGDVLARTLYLTDGRVLLTAGKTLSALSIGSIANLGYKGAYIESDEPIIALKGKAVDLSKDMLDTTITGKKERDSHEVIG